MKSLQGFIIFLCLFSFNSAYADFIVITNKQVDVNKEHEITARIDENNQILQGYAQADREIDPAKQKEVLKVSITWTTMLTKEGRIPLEGLTSLTYIEKPILMVGTSLLIKGNLPENPNIKKNKEDEDKKSKRDVGSSTTTGTTTNIAGPMQSPLDKVSNNTLFQPKVITTYEGCQHVYDLRKETIEAYQQSYYFDKNGKKVQVEACKPVKTFPAEKKSCDNFDDFDHHFTFIRYQPYFTVKNGQSEDTYAAGGCVPAQRYPHQLDYIVCEAQAVGSKYIKKGRWYFQTIKGDKEYISNCILDPENRSKDLLVEFKNCPVTHDIEHNQSVHLGKYYWVKENNTIEYLGDCVLTKQSYFTHQLEWKNEWEHHNDKWYSQRILTRFIYIPTEHRRIVIDDKELDPVHYPQTEEQEGWVHHDNKDRYVRGYSSKFMKRFTAFGTEKYFVGLSYEGVHVAHVYVGTDWTGEKESCGDFWDEGVRRTYVDHIKRPDDSKYDTNSYQGECD